MGQSDILELLEELAQPMRATDIAERMQDNLQKIFHHLKKLLDSGEISFFELNKDDAHKYFRCNRKTRLYYLAELKINKKDFFTQLESSSVKPIVKIIQDSRLIPES